MDLSVGETENTHALFQWKPVIINLHVILFENMSHIFYMTIIILSYTQMRRELAADSLQS